MTSCYLANLDGSSNKQFSKGSKLRITNDCFNPREELRGLKTNAQQPRQVHYRGSGAVTDYNNREGRREGGSGKEGGNIGREEGRTAEWGGKRK